MDEAHFGLKVQQEWHQSHNDRILACNSQGLHNNLVWFRKNQTLILRISITSETILAPEIVCTEEYTYNCSIDCLSKSPLHCSDRKSHLEQYLGCKSQMQIDNLHRNSLLYFHSILYSRVSIIQEWRNSGDKAPLIDYEGISRQ